MYNVGAGSANNQNVILESASINLEDPEDTIVVFGFYDRTTGARVGANIGTPDSIGITMEEEIKVYEVKKETNIGQSILIIENNDGSYESIIMHPKLLESTFTKLFFLDGKYTTHFDKFIERTSVTGDKIIAWDVIW
jgi:hypothetical protein